METVLASERLSFVGGNKLWILDRAGNVTGQLLDGDSLLGSAPVADPQGNLYFATSTLFSVKPDGAVRWRTALGSNLDPGNETTYTSQILLSPEGILYFAASDGGLYAVRAADGSTVWKRQVGLTSQKRALYVSAGVGDTLFVADVPYQAATGEPSAQPRVGELEVGVGSATYSGLLAGRYEKVGGGLQLSSYVIDRRGKLAWALPNSNCSWNFYLSGFDDTLLAAGMRNGSKDYYVYSASGQPFKGPTQMRGFPTTIGADGTIYNTERSTTDVSDATMTLVAYSQDLKELWNLDFGKPCTYSGTTLAEDGILYVTRQLTAGAGIELIAIQTASPGVAPTAYPTRRFNNRRTGWLGP